MYMIYSHSICLNRMSSDTQVETTPQRYMGQVKWFNNKAGYGFIKTRLNGEDDKDVFSHYSTIQVNSTQYKYLVQGEYVEFELSNSVSDTHEYQATQITGMKGGPLMCETRQLNRRLPREDEEALGPPPPTSRRSKKPRRNDADESVVKDADGFQKVSKKRDTRK